MSNSKTFELVYCDFLKYYATTVKEQSLKSFKSNFECHILPYFKDKDISKLKKTDFLNWKIEISKFNFKNSFNDKLYNSFNRFLRYCLDLDIIETNFLKALGPFRKKIENNKSDFYTLKEFNRFIKGFSKEDEVYKQFFILLFYTGLRPSEAIALKFSDIKGNRLSITKSIQRRGKRKIETPKTQSSIREIILDNKTLKGILNLKKHYLYYTDDFFIFGGSRPLSTSTIDRRKKKACLKVGIREITQHQFRHSHATLLLQNKVLINEVSRRLGHSRTSTTLDIYTHTNSEQEKRVNRLLNFLHFG